MRFLHRRGNYLTLIHCTLLLHYKAESEGEAILKIIFLTDLEQGESASEIGASLFENLLQTRILIQILIQVAFIASNEVGIGWVLGVLAVQTFPAQVGRLLNLCHFNLILIF